MVNTAHLNADGVFGVVLGAGYSEGGLDDQVAAEHGQPGDAVGLRVSHLVLTLAQPDPTRRGRKGREHVKYKKRRYVLT